MEVIDDMATTSITELLKEGFRIWKQGWLSFILSEILLFFAFSILLVPTMATANYLGIARETSPAFLNPILVSIMAIIGITFNSVVMGSFCGLGKELIEFEDTRAENTLYYVKKHGICFIGVGLVIAILIVVPLTLMRLFLSVGTNFEFLRGLAIIVFIIIFFLLAPFVISIPAAVIDESNAIESIKTSVNFLREDPKMVLGVLGFFTILYFLLLSPTLALTTRNAILTHKFIPIFTPAILAVIAFVCFFLLLFPMMSITFTKLYYNYRIPKKKQVSEEESPISLF